MIHSSFIQWLRGDLCSAIHYSYLKKRGRPHFCDKTKENSRLNQNGLRNGRSDRRRHKRRRRARAPSYTLVNGPSHDTIFGRGTNGRYLPEFPVTPLANTFLAHSASLRPLRLLNEGCILVSSRIQRGSPLAPQPIPGRPVSDRLEPPIGPQKNCSNYITCVSVPQGRQSQVILFFACRRAFHCF